MVKMKTSVRFGCVLLAICSSLHFVSGQRSEFTDSDFSHTTNEDLHRYEDRIRDPLDFFHKWENNRNPPVYMNEKQAAWWYSLDDYKPRNHRGDPPCPRPLYNRVPYEYPPYVVNRGNQGKPIAGKNGPRRPNKPGRSKNTKRSNKRGRNNRRRRNVNIPGRSPNNIDLPFDIQRQDMTPRRDVSFENRQPSPANNLDFSGGDRSSQRNGDTPRNGGRGNNRRRGNDRNTPGNDRNRPDNDRNRPGNDRNTPDNDGNRPGNNRNRPGCARGHCAGARCDEIPGAMRTRREYRVMTPAMRERFVAAVLALANYCPDGCEPCNTEQCISAYDLFVELHQVWQSPGAHGGASFYPWHREYLWRFENALIRHGEYPAELGLPYWDSILESGLPNPAHSVLWTPEYVGLNQGDIGAPFGSITVPEFCGFTVNRDAVDVPNNGTFNSFFFQEKDIQDIMSLDCFGHLTQNPVLTCTGGFPCNVEDRHGGPHTWIGGDMGSYCAPSDPVFWMHHGFVDYIWETHRTRSQRSDIEKEYPMTAQGGEQAAWNAPMAPFPGMINAHGLSSHYTTYYYDYAPRPSGIQCRRDERCNPLNNANQALWCDNRVSRCRSKIRDGGFCANLPNNACWCPEANANPRCQRGTCRCH